MIAYLPEIYPDELVYSWFCRYYVHTGCLTHKMAMQELFRKRSDNPSKEFIGNLNDDARKTITTMYDMDWLVINHTMFPQYARFISLPEKKEALHKLGHDCCDAHHLFPILPREESNSYFRYCPLCAAEDRENYGEAYWHRKHQIRNMLICTKHKCKLISSDIVAKSQQTFTFCDAESHIKKDDVVIEEDCSVILFSEYLAAVFDSKMNFETDVPLSSVLYYGLEKTKYMKSTGRSRYTKMFSEDMKKYYEKLNLPNVASIYQIQRTFLGDRNDSSVVCQIAFFMKMNVEDLTFPKLTDEQIKHEQDSHYMKNNEPIDWIQLDEETVPILEKIAKDIYSGVASETGRPERVSEKLLYRELELTSHRLDNMPKCRAILERYAEPYPESWARKLIWAYRKLQSERDTAFYWSDLRVLSGVKKHNFQETIPFLLKHSDQDTTDAITKLVNGSK